MKKIAINPLPKKEGQVKKNTGILGELLFRLEFIRSEILANGKQQRQNNLNLEIEKIKKLAILLNSRQERDNFISNRIKKSKVELPNFPGFIGGNPKIKKILKKISKWAKTPYPLLIMGETGTGKEVFSRLVHKISERNRFLPINCGAIPNNLIESELFGYVKGAFTGANSDRAGKFEEAGTGTLFLDEVGELPLITQVKLLRAIQFGEIQRLGSAKTVKIKARIIAATNCDLAQKVKEGLFREDLYYRLAASEVTIPPLRERRDEIAILLEFFMQKTAEELNSLVPKISSNLKKYLTEVYAYPGNIRELENIAKLLVVYAEDNFADLSILPPRYREELTEKLFGNNSNLKNRLNTVKREVLVKNLKQYQGSVAKVAIALELSASRVYQLCSKYQLIPGEFKRRNGINFEQ